MNDIFYYLFTTSEYKFIFMKIINFRYYILIELNYKLYIIDKK